MDARSGHDEAVPDGATEAHLAADEDEDAGGVDQPARDQQAQGQGVDGLDHRLQREDGHPAEQDVDGAPEDVGDAWGEHLGRHPAQGHGPDGQGEADRPGALEPLGGEGGVAAGDHQEDGRFVQPPQDRTGRARVRQVVDGRGGQHGHQAQGVDGRGRRRPDPAVDAGQGGQDHAADRRQAQTHGVDPQVGQSFGARLVVLDHVEVVGRPDSPGQVFQHGRTL